MRDTPVHVANERLKNVSGLLFNLGAVLLAAAGARVYADGAITFDPVWWTGMALVLISIAWMVLSLLQQEE